jgi:hypothetical protein
MSTYVLQALEMVRPVVDASAEMWQDTVDGRRDGLADRWLTDTLDDLLAGDADPSWFVAALTIVAGRMAAELRHMAGERSIVDADIVDHTFKACAAFIDAAVTVEAPR